MYIFMKNNYRLSCLTLFFILSFFRLSASEQFKVIDNTFGLPDNTVNCVNQDSHGFIWMGTVNGICRYDGMLFTTFRHDVNDAFSLSDNNVRKILPVSDGLVIAINKGVDFYSFSDGLFHKFYVVNKRRSYMLKSRMNSLLINHGNIIAADENGDYYIKSAASADCKFRKLTHGCKIYAINKFKNGKLLAVGSAGLYVLSADASHILYRINKKINITYNINIYYSKNSNAVFVGNGIGRKSLALKVVGDKFYEAPIAVPDNLMDVVDYKSSTVFAVDGSGLVFAKNGTLRKCTPQNSNISGDAIYSLFKDKNDDLWAGSYRAGVNLYSDKQSKFMMLSRANHGITYDIVTAVLDDRNKIYIGLDGGGLNIYDKTTKQTRVINTSNSNIAGNNVVSLLKDNDNVWMAIYTKGLVKYSIATSHFELFSMPSVKLNDENNVWTMCDDGLGNIWVGGPNISVFNKKTGKVKLIKSLIGVNCSSIQRDGDYVWIGASHLGVYKVDRRSYKILKHYSASSAMMRLPANDIKYIYVDSRARLWIAISYYGLYCIDEKHQTIRKYDYNQGLTDNNVVAIEEDHKGQLWMGTENGLFRFDSRTQTFARFDVDENISSTFTYNSSLFSGHTMFFGSTKGLVMFNPALIHYRQLYDKVSLTSLNLLNNDNKVFNLYGDSIKNITLSHDQNFFTIHFSVPELESPNRVHFSCRLKGLETSWRELSGSREVSYTNVPPGTYDFFVRCIDSNGHWVKSAVLNIVVTPPWYKTTWAIGLWIFLFVLLFVSALKFYLYELDIKHNMRISEIEKDTMKKLNDAKMTFYTNIIHELRTPVFLIAAQIEELMDVKTSIVNVPYSYLNAMYRSSVKLNKLISRIIDFRKMDSDKLKLALQRMNVVAFCQNLTEDYVNLCEQKDISFTFQCDKTDIQLTFDAEKLEMIISNLVSNAFKYTKKGGNVVFSIEDKDDDVQFSVKDNGIGIIEKMRDNIFESFFRTERGEKQSEGDGIGLSVVKNFVELHGGRITLESEAGKGSEFIFTMPKRKHSDDDLIDSSQCALDADHSLEPESFDVAKLAGNPTATHSVLIIDDEPQTIQLLERNLVSDFKVFTACDGVEGLEQAVKNLPDVIICDIMMPKMNGLEFLGKLKADRKLSSIKVLIFTAKTSEEDMLTAFDNGADAYVTKPISLKVLRKRIDRLIEQTDNAVLTSSITNKTNNYTKEEQIFLLRCREIIDDNLNNDDFSIDFLADKLAMSHSSLYKKVKQMTGMSLIEFINDYKIYKAVQMFKHGATNIETVCESCGFKDVKNFREMFKRKMKITPKMFVQSL